MLPAGRDDVAFTTGDDIVDHGLAGGEGPRAACCVSSADLVRGDEAEEVHGCDDVLAFLFRQGSVRFLDGGRGGDGGEGGKGGEGGERGGGGGVIGIMRLGCGRFGVLEIVCALPCSTNIEQYAEQPARASFPIRSV